ncbi:hypothetical protein [Nitrosovibrio sp. Nv4]|uniref:hypothetical protein n=1 Tax=Nitrosovibrio sp. Nv4 TaxID=1945880 RepID=UPI000BCFD400|nr:hypothetical protein [Nitrosovibrio sp. Nv4]SOD42299.1 hypothetical protein SAMN06298226_2637 [Nitrosovibrio sp. Nv4]
MSEIQLLLGTIAQLADVMQRCDAEVAQDNPTTDEEWDAALNQAAHVLLESEGRPL